MGVSSARASLVCTLTLAAGSPVSLSAGQSDEAPVRGGQTLWQTSTRDGFRYFSGNASHLNNFPAIYAHGGIGKTEAITVVGPGFREEFPMSRFRDAVSRYESLLEKQGYHPFDPAAAPLNGHPILGSWRISADGTECADITTFEPTGRRRTNSGEEVTESEFEISAEPDSKGYYRLVDTLREKNGRPGCSGDSAPIGHIAKVFIRFTNRESFSICQREDQASCFAGARRIQVAP